MPFLSDYSSSGWSTLLCVIQALEQQVSQEESSSQALRQEVLAKEHDVLELRTAMREVRLSPAPNPLPSGHPVFEQKKNCENISSTD